MTRQVLFSAASVIGDVVGEAVVLWLGVARLADNLSLICASGASSPHRQQQLAAVRDVHGALGRVIRVSLQPAAPAIEAKHATGHADRKFTKAADLIGNDLLVIRAEAADLRRRGR